MRRILLLFAALLLAWGCAATQIALEKKDLKVETLMSETIFLDVENLAERSVFVDVRNTSDKDLNIAQGITTRLQQKGYAISNNPKTAGYILQVNVLQVGMADPSALRASVYGGYGSTLGAGLAGATAGALIGGAAGNSVAGGAIGGLAAGTADVVAGSLVKDVTYSIMTDVMISEKTTGKVKEKQAANLAKGKGTSVQQSVDKTTNRLRYQTRVASSANQVNLKFEEALPPLQEGLARVISGIF